MSAPLASAGSTTTIMPTAAATITALRPLVTPHMEVPGQQQPCRWRFSEKSAPAPGRYRSCAQSKGMDCLDRQQNRGVMGPANLPNTGEEGGERPEETWRGQCDNCHEY